ncbi:MAG: phage baseplate assembly protein V [Pseudomonadota bacterium]
MSFETAEQGRKLAGALQIGVVTAINTGANTVRVQIGDLATQPIPVAQMRSGSVRIQFMPSLGEQVVVYAPGGDMARAFVQGSIPQANGAVASGAPGPVIHLGGATLSVIGDLDITGDVNVTGEVTVSADVIADGISLVSHQHSGVTPGGSLTGGPV